MYYLKASRLMAALLAMLLTVSLLVSGCGPDKEAKKSGEAQNKTPDELVLGYAASMTGKFSTEGTDVKRAYDLWAEQVNAKGGIEVKEAGKKMKVKLVSYDDTSDASTAVKMYEKLITGDKVDLLLSPWGSGNNFAVTAMTEKYEKPVLVSAGSSDSIFTRGLKYVFQTSPLGSKHAEAMIGYLKGKKDEVKTVAIAYENFLFTQTMFDALKPALEAEGFKVVIAEQYPMGGKDFAGLLTKVKSANPDAFILLNIMPASVYVTRQMNELKIKPKFYLAAIGPMFTKEFIEGLGDSSEGVVELGFWHQDLPYPTAKQFEKDFTGKFGKEPSTDAAWAYIACQVLQQAIERTGSTDGKKLAQAMHGGSFDTILGTYKYDDKGVNQNQVVFLTQVQNKKRLIVWPDNIAQAKLRFPVFSK